MFGLRKGSMEGERERERERRLCIGDLLSGEMMLAILLPLVMDAYAIDADWHGINKSWLDHGSKEI